MSWIAQRLHHLWPLGRSTRSTASGAGPTPSPPTLGQVIILSFLLQVTLAVGVTSLLSQRNGRLLMQDLTEQLQAEIGQTVRSRIGRYVQMPLDTIAFNAALFGNGSLTPDNPEALLRLFWSERYLMLDLPPSAIYFGGTDGAFWSVALAPNREDQTQDQDQWEIARALPGSDRQYQAFEALPDGLPGQLLRNDGSYDPRSRIWYRQAVAAGGPIWSGIYRDFNRAELNITAARPVYGPDQQLLGVVAVDFVIDRIQEFLEASPVSPNGVVYIVEGRSGRLVASSAPSDQSGIVVAGAAFERAWAADSPHPLIRASSAAIQDQLGGFAALQDLERLSFGPERSPISLQAMPLGKDAPDWLVISAIPEQDFMAEIQRQRRQTLALGLLALVLTLVLGLLTTRWITHPIRRLRQQIDALLQALRLSSDPDATQWASRDAASGDPVSSLAAVSNTALTPSVSSALASSAPASRNSRSIHAALSPGASSDGLPPAAFVGLDLPPFDPASAIAEVDELGRVFRTMATEIHDLIVHLEHRVSQRTQDLADLVARIRETQARLLEAEKLALLGKLVTGIAQAISPPLGNSILASSTLQAELRYLEQQWQQLGLGSDGANGLSDKGRLSEAVLPLLVDYLEGARQTNRILMDNLSQAAGLIASFKQVAVDQTHQARRAFALLPYLQQVCQTLAPQLARRGHQLQLDGDPELRIESYPGTLGQVIAQLLLNSLDHGYGPTQRGRLQLAVYRRGDRIQIRYGDDGRGIAAADQGQIFQPFFSRAGDRSHSGLGLHIVYNCVTQILQGQITCRSRPNRGTLFVLTLPLSLPASLPP